MTDQHLAIQIAQRVDELGGTAYYVGGFVRDALLNKECKDIDIEIHGISAQQLEAILDEYGQKIVIGKSFGVYNLKGYDLDIALPRQETLIGKGHKDFKVDVDPFIGTLKAAQRRDFTINALMQNVLTGEIIDHFSGVEDLKNRIIRHVNDQKFSEDPLRVFRAAQFAARFDFNVAKETMELCQRIDTKTLSKERIMMEMQKALLKASKPSVFFEVLKEMNQLDYWFSELKQLNFIEQNPKYHSEGNVFVHTMMVVDAAVAYREKVSYPLGYMISAVVHDYGKAVSTNVIDGVIHSYNHEIEGLPLVRSGLNRITTDSYLIKYVLNMTKLHMRPNILAHGNASIKATNKLFDEALEPFDLICLAVADGNGRIKMEAEQNCFDFLMERLEVFNELMAKPYVTGKDLIEAGLVSDKSFSEVLAYSHKLRLAGVDKQSALKQTLNYAKSLKN